MANNASSDKEYIIFDISMLTDDEGLLENFFANRSYPWCK